MRLVIDNDLYNLMKATIKKAQAISKYDMYLTDSSNSGCAECAALWQKLKEMDMEILKEMKKVFKAHFYKFNEY